MNRRHFLRAVRFPASGLLALACIALLLGCRDQEDSMEHLDASQSKDAASAGLYQEELLSYAIDNLNRLEEFDSSDALQQMLQRLNAQQPKSAKEIDPLLSCWPEPEMLRQIVDRLNQWIRVQAPPSDWLVDPMATALPKPLDELEPIKTLTEMRFSRLDGFGLQEVAWLRDIGLWARGDLLDDLARARSLFDWTVRNIQIEPEADDRIPLFPWETLLFGHGTAMERAWVFVLLARQSGIEAAVLAVGEPLRPWCVGVRIEGQVYLFDPMLGLPIPAPNGINKNGTGELNIQPATLAQVLADENILAGLNADEKHAYGVKSADLKHIVVMLEASQTYLSKRMALLESRLVGSQKMVLSTSPSEQATHWKAVAGISDAQIWLRPFETFDRRTHLDLREVQMRLAAILPFYAMPTAPLRRGRTLHLKGRFVGEDGATQYYQKARPSNEELETSSAHPTEKMFYFRGKQDASYWLGLIAYQREIYPSAVDYLMKRTLLFVPNGPWTGGARYNLARTYEASGDPERAILQYNGNDSSPGYLGDLLRAKWLKAAISDKKPAAESP